MNDHTRHILSILTAILLFGALLALAAPDARSLPMAGLFALLVTGALVFGIPAGGGEISLLPLVSAGALFLLGGPAAAVAVTLGAMGHGVARRLWPDLTGWPRASGGLALAGTTAANTIMLSGSVLAAGWVYAALGGSVPILPGNYLKPVAVASLVYLLVNYILAGVYFRTEGPRNFRRYLRELPIVVLYEAPTLIFAPLLALIFEGLGLGWFLLACAGLGVIAAVLRDQARARERLGRQVRELGGLQNVGRALAASLDLDETLNAVYAQVAELMPAENFYVALYNADADEVSFPLVVEEDRRRTGKSRRAANGLTETIIRRRQSLLTDPQGIEALRAQGMEVYGAMPVSWLGVPLLAGDEVLGMLAVQSYPRSGQPPQQFDEGHKGILETIAAQAATAIQNARLYARTDEDLTRRVQELNSILRTTREGLLLANPDLTVVAANRALADFLGLPLTALLHRSLLAAPADSEGACIAERIGYRNDELQQELALLGQSRGAFTRRAIEAPGPAAIPLERVVSPVLGAQENITGWLFVFRDLGEERRMARMRNELTHMLVHDLRAPLMVVEGGLNLIEFELEQGDPQRIPEHVNLALRGSQRMLDMIGNLLDISKLENGELTLRLEDAELPEWLEGLRQRFMPAALEAHIALTLELDAAIRPATLDMGLMDRVLANLVDNAIKFTPDGGRVTLSAQRGENHVQFAVEDNGPGIPEEAQAALFEKYRRVEGIVGRRGGNGLGLAFCKLAVGAHGGRIWVESKVGRGSAFYVWLPQAAPEEE
ncbi:MAG: GAF domain-containing protein [Chloroflexi bacterium]|nr:GAF domain-containing protein [Chloroflexota bacterium]